VIDRRTFLAGTAAVLLAAPLAAEAQQTGKVYRIGSIDLAGSGPISNAFLQGLKSLGWVEEQNFVFERRVVNSPTSIEPAASELVQLKVDLIIVRSAGFAEQVQRATRIIPIVVLAAGELGSSGLVASLTRPGGNVTGMQIYSPELMGKRLQLLKEAVPKLTRIVVLRGGPYPPMLLAAYRQGTDDGARTLGITLRYVEFQKPDELPGLFADMEKARDQAVFVWSNPFTTAHSARILDLAIKYRLPTLGEVSGFSDALMTYGPKMDDVFRQAAKYVDLILKGAKPGDLPIGQPRTFELFINLKTAKALGLTIPPSLLSRADEVIQ
jgi:putative ABC transport system substrate-binding protein